MMTENDPPDLGERNYDQDFIYFVKLPESDPITEENIYDLIECGVVKLNYLKTLLKIMNQV
jgi:hypothetical protein